MIPPREVPSSRRAADGKWISPDSRSDRVDEGQVPIDRASGRQKQSMDPSSRFKRLIYGGQCFSCGRVIDRDEKGWHDPVIKKVTCVDCPPTSRTDSDAPNDVQASVNPVAGSSALEIANKKGDPLFLRGAVGEYLLSQFLREQLGSQAIVLDDRKALDSDANIDHIVVAPSGVWVIDAKRWNGKIQFKNVGGWFGNNYRLSVAGRDKTTDIEKIYSYVIPVANLLANPSIPIYPALAFVDPDWRISLWRLASRRPYRHLRVWLTLPDALVAMIRRSGPLSPGEVISIGKLLDDELPARSKRE